MRVFLGMVLGVCLTILVAYVADAVTTAPMDSSTQTAVGQRPMVNWEVVGDNWHALTVRVRHAWSKLAAS